MAASEPKPDIILGLDFGEVRVGVALADSEIKLSSPLATLRNDASLLTKIKKLILDNKVDKLVIGLPRNLNGDETPQTASARAFASKLEAALELPVYLVDEAATSVEAEAQLRASGRPYAKGAIDALAAALILDNYLDAR